MANSAAQLDSVWHGGDYQAFPLGDDWVVLHASTNRLLRLNPTAYEIWSLWQAGLREGQITSALAARYDIDAQTLSADIARTVRYWATESVNPLDTDTGWLLPTQYLMSETPGPLQNARLTRHLQYDAAFSVAYGTPALEALVAPLFRHLPPPTTEAYTIEYVVEETDGEVRVRTGRRVIYQGDSADLAAVSLLRETRLAGVRGRDNLCILHAAAVGQGETCVLLPGIAGAGKSTLTAALLCDGFEYLTDDMVPVSRHNLQAIPQSPPLCIKLGSVDLLADRYPTLRAQHVFQREDQAVRYLSPPRHSRAKAPGYEVRFLVLPIVEHGRKAELSEVSPDKAFEQLLDAGIFVDDAYNPDQVRTLLGWLQDIKCYRLRYHDLGEACELIRKLFDNPSRSITAVQEMTDER